MPDMPEWVQVWTWLRFLRKQRVLTFLPQQEPHPEAMTEERYQEYRTEWKQAGSPTLSTKQVVAAMSGQVFPDPEDIPF